MLLLDSITNIAIQTYWRKIVKFNPSLKFHRAKNKLAIRLRTEEKEGKRDK